jgi:hypothetical protein
METIKDPDRRNRFIDSMFVHTEGAIMLWMKHIKPSVKFGHYKQDEYPVIQPIGKSEIKSKKTTRFMLKLLDSRHKSPATNPNSSFSKEQGVVDVVQFYKYAVANIYLSTRTKLKTKDDRMFFSQVMPIWDQDTGTWRAQFSSVVRRKWEQGKGQLLRLQEIHLSKLKNIKDKETKESKEAIEKITKEKMKKAEPIIKKMQIQAKYLKTTQYKTFEMQVSQIVDRVPVYGNLDNKKRYCAAHADAKMTNFRLNLCKITDCQEVPTFGEPNGFITHCEEHKLSNMVYMQTKCDDKCVDLVLGITVKHIPLRTEVQRTWLNRIPGSIYDA